MLHTVCALIYKHVIYTESAGDACGLESFVSLRSAASVVGLGTPTTPLGTLLATAGFLTGAPFIVIGPPPPPFFFAFLPPDFFLFFIHFLLPPDVAATTWFCCTNHLKFQVIAQYLTQFKKNAICTALILTTKSLDTQCLTCAGAPSSNVSPVPVTLNVSPVQVLPRLMSHLCR